MLSGPVGAGKTTVGRELVASSPDPVAYIEGDTFWSFIAKTTPGQGPNKNFKMIMTAMTAAAIPYALFGYEVIVDFSVPPWFLDTARKVVKSKEVPLDYVVLRPSETVCAHGPPLAPKARLLTTHFIVIYIRHSTRLSATPSRTMQVTRPWLLLASGMASTRGYSDFQLDPTTRCDRCAGTGTWWLRV